MGHEFKKTRKYFTKSVMLLQLTRHSGFGTWFVASLWKVASICKYAHFREGVFSCICGLNLHAADNNKRNESLAGETHHAIKRRDQSLGVKQLAVHCCSFVKACLAALPGLCIVCIHSHWGVNFWNTVNIIMLHRLKRDDYSASLKLPTRFLCLCSKDREQFLFFRNHL